MLKAITFILLLSSFYLHAENIDLKSPNNTVYKSENINYVYDDAILAEQKDLKQKFNYTIQRKISLEKYINYTKNLSRKSIYIKSHSYLLAQYTTKLLILYLNSNEINSAKKILDNYIDNILPYSDFNNKSLDVASNGIVLGIISKDDSITKKIFNSILKKNFKISKTDNELLLYNIACYHAVHNRKRNMLNAINFSLIQGKSSNDYLTDSDFKNYLDDPEFKLLLKHPLTKNTIDISKVSFEFIYPISATKNFNLTSKLKMKKIDDTNLFFKLLLPDYITLKISSILNNKKLIFIENIKIKNTGKFLKRISNNLNMPIGNALENPTLNKDFTLGVLHETKDTILLYNASHTMYDKASISETKYRINYHIFEQEINNLLQVYESFEKHRKQFFMKGIFKKLKR